MTLDEILLLPLVETYELDDEPADFEDLCELCHAFEDHRDIPELECILFPVGEAVIEDPNDTAEGEQVYMQSVEQPVILQERPIVFKVEDMGVTDYGVVQGATLSVYRHKESV